MGGGHGRRRATGQRDLARTLVARSRPAQDQPRDVPPVCDGVLLRQKAAEAAAAHDGRAIAGKVPPHAVDVVDNLRKRVRRRGRALAVAAVVKRQHAEAVLRERAVRLEVGLVAAWRR